MTKTPSPSHRRAHPTRRDSTNDNQKKSGRGNKDNDDIIQITNTPTPAKWPGHYICLVLDCDKQSQSQTDGYCKRHYNRIKRMKKGRIEVVETPTKNNTAAADSKQKQRRKNVDSDEDSSESGESRSSSSLSTNKKSQQKRRRRRRPQQKQREQQLAATTTKKETRNRKQLMLQCSPRRRIKSRPVYTELDDSEFEDNDDEDTDDALTATTLNSRRRKNTKWRPPSEQQLLQQKRKYNRRRMRKLRGQECYSDDDIEVLEDTEDDDDEEVVFISSSPGRSRRSNNRTNGNNSRRNSTSSRQGQQVKKRKLDSSSTPTVKKMRHNGDYTHTMTAGGNNNSSRRRGKSTKDDDGDDGNLPPFDIKPSESLLLSSKKEGGTGRLRLRNKNNTERILLERTRHELLTGRDYWICTTCIKSVPSLTLTCEHCNQLISFVPLTMNEFMRFVHRQRSIGNKSYTTTTTLARDEEVYKSSMAIQSSMGVETVKISQTEQEQTSQLETADAEMKSLKSEVSSFTNLHIQKEQGFIMEHTSPIVTSIPEEQSNSITEGSLVVVQSRTWPGINKLGGVGRVIKVHLTAAGKKV